MNPETLALLLSQAKEKAEQAQREFARLQRLVDQAQAHLQVLQRYSGEYEERASPRAGQLRDPQAQDNQRKFLGRLDGAVQTQEREVALRREASEAAGAELARCLKRHKSLETLLRRQQERARLAQARRDQKNTDEFAQRAHERSQRERRPQESDPARRVS